MEVLKDLSERLSDMETRVVDLLKRLEKQAEIEKSLDVAGKSLGDASSNVSKLSASTREVIEPLKNILTEFHSAIQILEGADPARVAAAVVKVQEQLSIHFEEMRSALSTNEEALLRQATDAVAMVQKLLMDQHVETLSAVSKAKRIGYLALGIIGVLAVGFVLLAYRVASG